VRISRTVTALVSASALVLLSVPIAVTAEAVSAGAPSATRWYQGRTGTVQWAIGPDFQAQLDASGASLNFCSAAKIKVDSGSGITIVTMPVHGNSVIALNGPQSSIDAVTECAVTVSGNGATVELTNMGFGVYGDSPSDMTATIADEYTTLGEGARMKLPKKATSNKLKVVSPVIMMSAPFADILRAAVPTLTTDATALGLFQLTVKVKPTKGPMSSGNSEG
jgi:hypothetical protein